LWLRATKSVELGQLRASRLRSVRIRWYGQSAFLLTGERHRVFIDPFGDVSALTSRGIEWRYPPVENVDATWFW
jgi:L-ascorbate metabolism protein UlaG (beta-lactamase superfamily)